MEAPQSAMNTPLPEPLRLARILVATDFSPCAAAALDWAIEIARAHGARIDLVHAIETISTCCIPAELQAGTERSLAGLERTAQRCGVEAASRYRIGRAWEVVAEAERQLHPGLVVIGARGRTSYAPPSLGSRADRMLRTACAPVLTVHASDKGRQSSIRTVLVATDFSEEAALATSTALRLARALPERPRLVLVHAWQPIVDFNGLPVVDASLIVHLDDTMKSAERLLDQAASALRGRGLDVTAVVRQGYPAAIIEQEARASGADLVAVGTHGRSGLRRLLMGSIAERVVHHAPCPVLAVRRPGVTEPLRLSEPAEGGGWTTFA